MARQLDENILQIGLFHFFGSFKTGSDQLINQFVGRVEGNDPSGVNDGHSIAEVFGLIHVMGGDDDGCTAFADTADQFPQTTSCLRIQSCLLYTSPSPRD
mgnify:CR=1 FL=1